MPIEISALQQCGMIPKAFSNLVFRPGIAWGVRNDGNTEQARLVAARKKERPVLTTSIEDGKGADVGYIADGALAVEGSRIVAVDSTVALLRRFECKKLIEARSISSPIVV